MIRENLHTHSTYCDGKDAPRDMILRALELGFTTLGFSGHSFTSIDPSYCMPREGTAKYKVEIQALSEEFAGKIRILCGVEQDYYADDPPLDFDYVIGSVHYIEKDGLYLPVDYQSRFPDTIAHFGGDYYAFCEAYYALVQNVAEKTHADIIGHFDLVTKFNEREALFSEDDARYKKATTDALDALLPYGKPFEINTGAMAKGYRTSPYPSKKLRDYIIARGGKLILSSDCHDRTKLDFGFSSLEAQYKPYLITYNDIQEAKT